MDSTELEDAIALTAALDRAGRSFSRDELMEHLQWDEGKFARGFLRALTNRWVDVAGEPPWAFILQAGSEIVARSTESIGAGIEPGDQEEE